VRRRVPLCLALWGARGVGGGGRLATLRHSTYPGATGCTAGSDQQTLLWGRSKESSTFCSVCYSPKYLSPAVVSSTIAISLATSSRQTGQLCCALPRVTVIVYYTVDFWELQILVEFHRRYVSSAYLPVISSSLTFTLLLFSPTI
jgi:hypothetical protein